MKLLAMDRGSGSPAGRVPGSREGPTAALRSAWRGYIASFPNYVVYSHRIADNEGTVAVLGHTTGSHLGLADDGESRLTLIWLAEVVSLGRCARGR